MKFLTTLLFFIFLTVNIFSQQEQKVYTITLKGIKRTKQSTIEKLLDTKKNEILDSLVLKKDIVRLKRLPAISHADFSVFHSHENFYNVFINIEENHTVIPIVNIWTATKSRFAYKLGVYDYNFLGRNMTLGGFYQNNGFDTYAINFRAPNLFSRKLGLAINYLDWKSEEPLYFENSSANYKYNNVSYEVLGLYELNFKNNFQLGINFFKEKYNYLNGQISEDVPRRLNLDKTLLKLVYTFDNLDYDYQYINGFKSEFYGQFVTSTNEYQDDFLIAWNDFFYYKRVGEKGNWANRLRVGLSSNKNTPFAPFSLDNNVNLRGVGILVDRGTGSIVWNTEYRNTLYEKGWFILQGNIFVDTGTWRNPGGELNDFFKEENIKVYSGLGLRFIHKKIFNAVFRIDYGYGLTKNSSKGLVFGIGQYF